MRAWKGAGGGAGSVGGRGQDCGLVGGAAGRAVFRQWWSEGRFCGDLGREDGEEYVRGSRADGGERRRCCEGELCERRWWGRGLVVEEGRLMEVGRARCGGGFGWGSLLGMDQGGLTDACESGVWVSWGLVSALEVDVHGGWWMGWGLVGWSGEGSVGDARGCEWDVYWCSVDDLFVWCCGV